ncbi:MAG TPA: AtpZ/AtpI family protein [Rhizomicrobium sp.]|jgi:ATP synthase protein I|nr:AtpZ/AtpI family protein [Rhizomicrobium sp.]
MSNSGPNPDKLRELGAELDEIRRKEAAKQANKPAPTSLGIAFRFSTEMVAALIVGGGLGWGLDRLLGTRPIFLLVFFVLGAAAGIRNVMRAAQEINAEMSAKDKGN